MGVRAYTTTMGLWARSVLEDEYGVILKGEDMKELKTVGQAIDLIVERAD